MTNHGYLGYVVIVNKKFWNALPGEIQIELISAMNETTKYADVIARQKNEQDLRTIKNSGKTTVIELNDEQKKLWFDTLFPVRKQMENRIGKELLDEIQNELNTTNQQ